MTSSKKVSGRLKDYKIRWLEFYQLSFYILLSTKKAQQLDNISPTQLDLSINRDSLWLLCNQKEHTPFSNISLNVGSNKCHLDHSKLRSSHTKLYFAADVYADLHDYRYSQILTSTESSMTQTQCNAVPPKLANLLIRVTGTFLSLALSLSWRRHNATWLSIKIWNQ